nr:hypothetical protein [Tanacetum cinerariifolium]
MWSATIVTRGNILPGSAELQEIKTTSTRKAQEGAEEGPNYALMAFTSLSSDSKEFANKCVAENTKSSEEKTKAVRKNDDALIIEEWVSDNEEENNKVPKEDLTCLFAKATSDESKLWHRRLGDLNFKTMNKLVKGNLARGLPSKLFENDQACVACQRGNQHIASYHLGKFDVKADEGFFVGYSLNSKAFRVFNSRTRIVEENLHIRFTESTPNVVGSGPDWLFDIDALTRILNYELVVAGTQSNGFTDPKSSHDDGSKPSSDDGNKVDEDPRKETECKDQEKEDNINSTNNVNTRKKILNDDEDDGPMADMNNLDTTIQVSPVPPTKIHKDHPLDQVIEDVKSDIQTRNMSKNLNEHGFDEPKKVIHVLKYPSWIEAMQEEPLQFNLQEGVKSFFLYEKIEEEVYVYQPLGFEDPDFPDRVYKVEKALYRLHQAPRAWYETLSTYLLDNGFQRGKITKTLFIKRHKGDILLVQVYVDDIIFGSTKKELCITFERFTKVKTASTPMETQKPLLKDEDGEEVDVHMYRSMIGSLMYLTSSRPDIMFAVCACARYQVNPKVSHLHVVKWIFRYLKGQPKLGLWYPKDSPFDLVAYTDSDYARASLDRKSTIGGYQFLGCRLISWQCKKQTVVANSTT